MPSGGKVMETEAKRGKVIKWGKVIVMPMMAINIMLL